MVGMHCDLTTSITHSALDAGFRTKRVPIIMAVAYTLTTPIGVSIGVAISATYHADAVDALLTQGILDAVSAGILIYDALVNLLTVNVTHSDYFSSLTNVRKTMVMLSLWSGAGIMSLIGRWA